jgi:hypothetical protein
MRASGPICFATLFGLGCGGEAAVTEAKPPGLLPEASTEVPMEAGHAAESGTPSSHVPGTAWAYAYANPYYGGKILGLPFGGGTPTVLAMGGNIGAQLTFDSARIYYSAEGFDDAGLPTYSLAYVPLAGGVPSSLVTSYPLFPSIIEGIASNGQNLYVSRQDNIPLPAGSSTLQGFIEAIAIGGSPVKLQTVSAHLGGVAVDDRYVYWTQEYDATSAPASGSIHRTALAGGPDETLATGQLNPVQVALDASGVYWINLGTPGRDCTSRDGTLVRLAPGSMSPVTLMTGLQGPGPITAHGGNVYLATEGAFCNASGAGRGTIYRVASTGGQPTVLVSGSTAPADLYADGTYLYYTVVDSYNGVVTAGVVPM